MHNASVWDLLITEYVYDNGGVYASSWIVGHGYYDEHGEGVHQNTKGCLLLYPLYSAFRNLGNVVSIHSSVEKARVVKHIVTTDVAECTLEIWEVSSQWNAYVLSAINASTYSNS